jgi:hypothetical protein
MRRAILPLAGAAIDKIALQPTVVTLSVPLFVQEGHCFLRQSRGLIQKHQALMQRRVQGAQRWSFLLEQ